MSSGLFTTSNLLIGAGALAAAAIGGGVLYTSIKKPPPDEKAAMAEAAFAQVDEDAAKAKEASAETSGEGGFAELAASQPMCPEDLVEKAANQGWLELCGTGRPPAVTNPLDGVWDVDTPGNPKIDDLIVYINTQYGILHRGDPNQPSPAHGVWQRKEDAPFYSTSFAVRFSIAEDGMFSTALGQFDFCMCGQIKWRVRPTSDSNMMIGEWRYDDEQGVSIWRKRSTKSVIRSVTIDRGYQNGQGEWVSDQFGYRSRQGRIARNHPVTCCDSVYVTTLGDNFAGNPNVWIDPATHIELWEGEWVCKNGEMTGGSRWDHCGVGVDPGANVAGIRIRLKLREGVKPGLINLWVGGQPIPINVVINGYPEEEAEKPKLVTLHAFDLANTKIATFTEGDPFFLEAVFDSAHPDSWVNVELPMQENVIVAGAVDNEAPEGALRQSKMITLQRMADNKTFRSGRLAIQSAGTADE